MNKRIVSALLAGIMLVSSAACGAVTTPDSVTAASSSSEKYAEWLDERLGDGDTTEIVVGTADDAAALGVDVSSLRDEGYTIRKSGNSAVIVGKTADGLDRGVRYYAKNIASLDSATYTYGEGYAVKKLTIAGNDIAEYTIVLPEDTSYAGNKYAATELQKYIANACGANLPIVAYGTAVEGHTITLERVMKGSDDYAEFGDESFLISVDEDGDLLIKGGYYRGCLYGVYEFLESYVGYRFVTNYYEYQYTTGKGNIDYVYESDHIDVPTGTHDMQSPSFDYRDSNFYYHRNYTAMVDLNQDAKLKTYRAVPAQFYSYIGILGMQHKACHGIKQVADAYDETIILDNRQPCFSSDEFVEFAIDWYIDYIKGQIKIGRILGEDTTTIDVSQWDSGNFCMCRTCQKQNQQDGGYVGSLMTFTNKIAEAIENEFGADSGLKVSMLIYYGTMSVPKVTRPRDNVMISFCFYNDLKKAVCYSHPFDGKSCTGTRGNTEKTVNNSLYAEEFEGWCDIMPDDSIIIWYYPGTWDWGCILAPTEAHIRDDLAYLASFDAVYGIFTDPAPNSDNPADLVKPYLIKKLMWNVNITDDEYQEMIKEYFTIILGEESAECIYAYMRAASDLAYDCCWTTMAWTDPSERLDASQVIENIDYFIDLFERALDCVTNEDGERMVKLFYTAMLHMELIFVHDPWYLNGDDASRARYTELFEQFIDMGNEAGYARAQKYMEESGKSYDIEENPSNIYDYNNASDGDAEWWLG